MKLRRITEIPCTCPDCSWKGVTGDCEADGEGELCCPRCYVIQLSYRVVVIEYNDHERAPTPQGDGTPNV